MADIFSDIFKFAGSVINQAVTPDNLRDYRHASKLFVDDQYRLMPKLGFLFYVKIELNAEYDVVNADPQNPNSDREIGLLVKSCSLPKFSIDTKKFNAYNRPNYSQSKINYDPVTITFHDDSSNVVRNFWYDYYSYYYRDSDYNEELYRVPHKYEGVRSSDKWGFTPRNNAGSAYIKSIRIYSMHQKRFSEYVLINPIIKSFRHGDHQQGQNETLQHEMTVEYESVLYYYGSVTPSNVPGFADLHYDKMPSPLTPAGGGTKSILGPGGLLETGDDVLHDLKDGNYGSALFKGIKGLKNASSMDLKKAAIGEVLAIGTGVLRGNNPQNNIFVPSLPSLGSAVDTIGARLGVSGLLGGGGFGGGLGSSNSWLAGAAGLGVAAASKFLPSGSSPTDASVNLDDIAPPATPYDELPVPDPNEFAGETAGGEIDFGPFALSIQEQPTTVSPAVQTSINGYGSKLDLANKISLTKQKIHSLHVTNHNLKNQQQLADDAVVSLTAQKEVLVREGMSNREIDLQIEQQINIGNNAMEKITLVQAQIAQYTEQLEKTQYQYNSLI